MAGCEVMQGQKGILVLSPDSASMFLYTRGKQVAGLARMCVGALRARDILYEVSPSLRWKRVFHVFQCSPEKFRLYLGGGEVVGLYMSS